jgi:hypothetical protein
MIFGKLKKIGKILKPYNLRSMAQKNKSKNRKGQSKFREQLIKKFDSKCALLGIHSKLCDAAHIFPYADCKSTNDKYNVNNGILLSATLHKAYDRNYFRIDEKTCQIKINYENLEKDDIHDLKDIGLNGFEDFYIKEIDNKEGREYLKKRNLNIRNK